MRLPLAILVLLVAALPAAALDPAVATFPDAHQKDDLRGLHATGEIARIVIPARPGMTLDVRLTPDGDTPSTGLTASLFDPSETDLAVTGSAFDRSRAGRDEIKWKNVQLSGTGDHVLDIAVGSAGSWRVRLGGKSGGEKVDETSTVDLAPGMTFEVPFSGLAGDTVKWKVSRVGKSDFAAQIVRIARPDGSSLFGVPGDAKGAALLDADGEHRLVFENTGGAAGAWRTRIKLKTRKERKRSGYVSAAQTGLVPVVTSLNPKKGVHQDTALLLELSGRDFQSPMDVRLERNGRDDIIAADVEVTSDTTASCIVDLDTRDMSGNGASAGKWKVAVWNLPIYGDPGDPATLDETSPLVSRKKSFQSITAGSVNLPSGVRDDTEVWVVRFNDDFQTDLDRMGLGSDDPAVRRLAREITEAYVIAYLRDLFGNNETNGAIQNNASVPVSFVVDPVTAVAGAAGEAYNRIDVGGKWQEGDPQDAAEPLSWGFTATDTGNASREDLTTFAADGTTRLGLGVRTGVLNPEGTAASPSFVTATQPLRDAPLTAADEQYLSGSFNGNIPARVARYAKIVTQLERTAREIAAIIGHHVGRAMGLPTAGTGPMQADSLAGRLWKDRDSLTFDPADMTTLRANAVPHALPGKSGRLGITFLQLEDQQAELIPNLTTGTPYTTDWNFVGGRCNAMPSDYKMQYTQGSRVLPGLTLTFNTLAGTVPVCVSNSGGCENIASVVCGVFSFQLAVTDTVRDEVTFIFHRLKALPDLAQIPGQLLPQATTCRNEVLAAP